MALDKKGAPIVGWTLTTGRPIPGYVPKKGTRKGTVQGKASGRVSKPPPRKTRASNVHRQATTALQSSETTPEELEGESSVDSDDTVMREIDEVARASGEGENVVASPAVNILSSGSHKRTSPRFDSPRSSPPSFEDFVEEEVVATLTGGVKDSLTSQPLPELPLLPQ